MGKDEITLTLEMVHILRDMCGGEPGAQIVVVNDGGAIYAFDEQYPEEGAIPLNEEAERVQASHESQAAADNVEAYIDNENQFSQEGEGEE